MKRVICRTVGVIASIVLIWSLAGCRTVKEVPVQTIEKVIVKDSIVRITDTVKVPIPVEKIVEVIPEMDTSILKTSVAESMAFLDREQRKINHTLKNRNGALKTIIDTCYLTQTVDRIVETEVPVEVEVVKHRYDALFWVSISFNILTLLIMALKIWLRK